MIDGNLFGGKGNISIYIIENDDIRLMIDTSEKAATPKIIEKLKEFKIYPIHKIFLTHAIIYLLIFINLIYFLIT